MLYVTQGMRQGFRIGHAAPLVRIMHSQNHPSSLCNSQFVSTYLDSCCVEGQTWGPFDSPPFTTYQCSGLGVIPKKNGKFRVIHDLSSPQGSSVNDAIPPKDFSLQYESVDTAINYIMHLGKGSLLTKVDIRNAFRLCPVNPADIHLLGINWQGQYFFERVLPFGLRSSPYIFDRFASALEWILRDTCHLAHVMHYLDDFLDVAQPNLAIGQHHRALILDTFNYLNVPVAPEKVEGPTTVLTFLGLELDTVELEVRLPEEKRSALLDSIQTVQQATSMTKRELASLLGHLSFASRAVPAGRTFLRRLYDFDRATSSSPPAKKLRVPTAALEDLHWWKTTLTTWPGKSFFLQEQWTPAPDMRLQTDASGSLGYGAYYNGHWFAGQWSAEQQDRDITYKELYAIVVACATWGNGWTRKRIEFQCDNQAVVQCIKSGTCRSPHVMGLIRALYWLCVEHNILVRAVHIPGISNTVADALSRGFMQVFRRLAPTADLNPTTPVLPMAA